MQERARFNAAVDAFNEGATLHGSAKLAHMPLTTFRRRLHKHLNQNADMKHQRLSLTPEKEQCIIDLVSEYASRGYPIAHRDIKDSVELLVKEMDDERRK